MRVMTKTQVLSGIQTQALAGACGHCDIMYRHCDITSTLCNGDSKAHTGLI